MAFNPTTLLAFDCETTGLRPWHGDSPFCISMCDQDEETLCFEFDVDPFTRKVTPNKSALRYVRGLLRRKDLLKGGHNVKFDIRMLECAFGIKTCGPLFDTMYMAHACRSGDRGRFGLKWQAENYLGMDTVDEELLLTTVRALRRKAKLLGWKIGYEETINADGVTKQKAAVKADYWLPRAAYQYAVVEDDTFAKLCRRYCILDATRTRRLFEYYQQAFDAPQLAGARRTYLLEMELWPVTYAMESRGIRVDLQRVQQEKQDCTRRRTTALQMLRKVGGTTFNPNSTRQVGQLWKNKLRLPFKEKTTTGLPQVNHELFQDHQTHPVVSALIEYKSMTKAITSYFNRYEQLAVVDSLVSKGTVIHCDYKQTGTATRRYSCQDPNLQNITNTESTRSAKPFQARKSFRPRPGYVWLHLDYDQLEARMFACFAKEQFMLNAYRAKRDLFTECANKVWGGIHNPASVRAAVQALELTKAKPSSRLVQDVWKSYGVTLAKSKEWGCDATLRNIAREWLRSFKGDIVAAERSVGKKVIRQKAKTTFYAKIFVGGPRAVKNLIGCSWNEAASVLGDFDSAFPGMVRYIRGEIAKGRSTGCVFTPWGHRIQIDLERDYTAVNYRIQGSAAMHLKRAMIVADRYLRSIEYDAHLVLTIHDELVWEIPADDIRLGVIQRLRSIMEDHGGTFELDLPVSVCVCSDSWEYPKELELGEKTSRVPIGVA